MKKFTKVMMVLAAAFTTLLAVSSVSSACIWGAYQPKEPKCLTEE